MNKDGTVSLCIAGQIFLPRGFLDDLAIFPKHLDFVAIIRTEVIVKSLSADGAPHAVFSILAEKQNHFSVEIEFLFLVGKF